MQKIKDKGEILKEARGGERKPHQLTSKDKNHIELLKSHANKSNVKYLKC